MTIPLAAFIALGLFQIFEGVGLLITFLLLKVIWFIASVISREFVFGSSLIKQKTQYILTKGLTQSQFEQLEKNYTTYSNDLRDYEYKFRKTNNDTSFTKSTSITKSTPDIITKSSGNSTDKSKENPKIISEKVSVTSKEDPELNLLNPFDTLFISRNQLSIKSKQIDLFTQLKGNNDHVIDDILSAQNKQLIGDEGELFVLEYEKKKLDKYNLGHLISQIRHTAKIDGDKMGYDIASFNNQGEKILIEVKTTVGDFKTPFYITDNEYETRKQNLNYFIYRVFNFDLETKKGKLFIISPQIKIDNYFLIEPKVYKLTPHKAT